MTEYDEVVVRVDTVEEYRAVLEKWFKEGHDWYCSSSEQKTHADYFTKYNARYLLLEGCRISHSTGEAIDTTKAMSFKEFMAKERGEVTYEVSEEQMAFIKEVKESPYPASYLMVHDNEYRNIYSEVDYGSTFERDLLRYLGGDDSVVFQLKDPLFMLKGRDPDGDIVYFTQGLYPPSYTYDKEDAFTAPHEEITHWKTPFWEIEPVEV